MTLQISERFCFFAMTNVFIYFIYLNKEYSSKFKMNQFGCDCLWSLYSLLLKFVRL